MKVGRESADGAEGAGRRHRQPLPARRRVRARGRPAAAPTPPWPDGVRVVDYGIRGMHLAYDLLER